jgi:protein MpaA
VQPRPVADPLVRRQVVLGYSVAHRPIIAEQIGDSDSPRRVLVVGCIHGNEPAGIAIARALTTSSAPSEVDLWVVLDLNPDGVARDTRGNANGVDLNRNFPDHWQPLGPAGSTYYAGPRPLSEPETRIAGKLLLRLRPTLGIWYHQALHVVDDSQGPPSLERRYAADARLPLRRLPDYPGSAVGYEDQQFGPTAFVVELLGGSLTSPQLARQVQAVLDIAARSAPARA